MVATGIPDRLCPGIKVQLLVSGESNQDPPKWRALVGVEESPDRPLDGFTTLWATIFRNPDIGDEFSDVAVFALDSPCGEDHNESKLALWRGYCAYLCEFASISEYSFGCQKEVIGTSPLPYDEWVKNEGVEVKIPVQWETINE